MVTSQEIEDAVLQQLELSVDKMHAKKHTEQESRELHGDELMTASLGALIKSGSRNTDDLTVKLLFVGTKCHHQPRDRALQSGKGVPSRELLAS